ncbi:MAG: hypothetical protein KBS52_03830 [Clostridiales bacterium]|nr:hypothetical protein [Candidatus Equinaster intestinalis]
MLKKISLFVLVLMMAVLAACAPNKEGIAATVFGEDILKADIEEKVEYSRKAYEISVKQINGLTAVDAMEKAKMLEKLSKPENYEEVLNEQIERLVLLHEAGEKNIKADGAECKKQAQEVFASLKAVKEEDYENYQTYLYIKESMQKKGLTEEEYIESLAENYSENQMINLLKEDYGKNSYVLSETVSLDEAFENYTKDLVEKSKEDIIYY